MHHLGTPKQMQVGVNSKAPSNLQSKKSRGGRTRTGDPRVPNAVRYHTAPHPVARIKIPGIKIPGIKIPRFYEPEQM